MIDPKYLLNYDRRYILDLPKCHELKVFKWLRDNGGPKKLKWNCHSPSDRWNTLMIVQIYFNDDAVEALFKLSFGDLCLDVSTVAYANMFPRPRMYPDT